MKIKNYINRKYNKVFKKLILVSLVILLLSCCKAQEIEVSEMTGVVEKDFMTFANDIAYESTIMSPLNASFTYGDLEARGLKGLLFEMDDYSAENYDSDMAYIEDVATRLGDYKRSELNDDEKMIYDMLAYQIDVAIESEDYSYYTNNFNPSFGLQVLLPLTLTQLELESEVEVEGFLARIKQIPVVLEDAIAFEYEKANRELLLQPYLYDLSIEQIKGLVEAPESFMLYQGFVDQIDEVTFLTEEQKIDYKQRCLDIVRDEVFPSYKMLTVELAKIRDLSTNVLGTSEFDNAEAFYEHQLYAETSYKMSIKQMTEFLEDEGDKQYDLMDKLLNENPEIYDELSTLQFGMIESMDKAKEMAEIIMEEQFYDYGVVSAKEEVIPSYLEDHLPAGFYFVTSVDLEDYGTMYLREDLYENIDVDDYSTLLHENIPGHHLYFSVLYTQDLPFVQQTSDWSPFAEGYAVYIQSNAYTTMVENPLIMEYLDIYFKLSYIEEMQRDMDVHVYGMTKDDLMKELVPQGYTSDMVDDMYNRMISNPAEVYRYYFSYFKMKGYRSAFEQAYGDDFEVKEFHDFLLKHINIPFSALDGIVDEYLKKLI